MKTVKDVVAEYPDGWPMNGTTNHVSDSAGYNVKTDALFTCHSSYQYSNKDEYKICTREEYERELAKTNSAQWYDYDKQETISLPPVGVECEVSNCGNDYIWCKVVFMGSSLCVVNHKTHNEQHYHLSSVEFHPLDWNKNKVRDEFIDKFSNVCNKDSGVYHGTGTTQLKTIANLIYNAGARFND